MSVSNLLVPNTLNLFCGSITPTLPSPTTSKVTVTNTTDSSSSSDTTASISTQGGLSVAKKINAGANINAPTISSSGLSTLNSLTVTTASTLNTLTVNSTSTTTGLQTANGGVQYLSTGASSLATLNFYETLVITTTASGPFTTPISTTFNLTRLGNIVFFQTNQIVGPTTNTSAITFDQSIPTRFLPIAGGGGIFTDFLIVTTGGVVGTGSIQVNSFTGAVTVNSSVNGGLFAPVNTGGYNNNSFTWQH